MLPATSSLTESIIIAACNSLGDGVIVIGEDRSIRYMNPAASEILGLTEAESGPAGRCLDLLQCGPHEAPNRNCSKCRVEEAMRKGDGPVRFSVAVGRPDYRVMVDVTCSPVPGRRRSAALVLRPRPQEGERPAGETDPFGLTPQSRAVLQGLVRSARELLVADYAGLGRLDEFRLEVVWLVQEGSKSPKPGIGVPLGQGIRGRVVSTGQPICIPLFPDMAPDPPELHVTMQAEGLRAALAVPVIIKGEPAGVLMVAKRDQAEYGPEQTQVLRNLAGLAAEVFQHADWVIGAQAASIRSEREWLAAELHDGLAQLLGAITQRLKLTRWVLGRSTEPATLASDLQEVLELSEKAHQELRLALGELRTPAAGGDFQQALEATLRLFNERSRLKAELTQVPDHRPPISPPVTLQILRIIQEALNNARKHSGGSRAWVRWSFDGQIHTFTVRDDGHGFVSEEAGHGFGLAIMCDRARRIGGDLRVYGPPESGCTVTLTVPHQGGGDR